MVWGNFPPHIPNSPARPLHALTGSQLLRGKRMGIDGTGSPHTKLTWYGDRFWFPSSGCLLETKVSRGSLVCEPVSITHCNPNPSKPNPTEEFTGV